MKASSLVVGAVVVLISASASIAAPRNNGPRKALPAGNKVRAIVTPATQAPQAGVFTITYDNNTPFSRRGENGGTVGSNFNTGTDPHDISTGTFRLAGHYLGSVFMTFWDVNPASFMLLDNAYVTGLPFYASITAFTVMAPLPAPIVGHNGAFIGGIWNSNSPAFCSGVVSLNNTCDGVAMTMGGVDPGMGFHGHRVPNVGDPTPPPATVAGVGTAYGTINAIFRATGNNLPVELMNFGVE